MGAVCVGNEKGTCKASKTLSFITALLIMPMLDVLVAVVIVQHNKSSCNRCDLNHQGAKACNVFEPRTATGNVLFSYLTSLHTSTFVFKYLFTSGDDQSQNLRKTLHDVRILTIFRSWLKKVAYVGSGYTPTSFSGSLFFPLQVERSCERGCLHTVFSP